MNVVCCFVIFLGPCRQFLKLIDSIEQNCSWEANSPLS